MMAEAKVIDWQKIEHDYRAGLLSVREIAAANGITHGAINKRAKRDAWTRDLSAKIKARAEELVSRRAVSAEVSTEKAATERQIIESNAERIAAVQIAHRGAIQRGHATTRRLMDELEAVPEPEAGKELQALNTKTMIWKALTDTAKTWVGLERQAYGIADGDVDTGDDGRIQLKVVFVGARA